MLIQLTKHKFDEKSVMLAIESVKMAFLLRSYLYFHDIYSIIIEFVNIIINLCNLIN